MNEPTASRKLTINEQKHFHDFAYQQDLFAFSDVIWKNILAAIENAEDPERASKAMIVQLCTPHNEDFVPPAKFFEKAGLSVPPAFANEKKGFAAMEEAEREISQALKKSARNVKVIARSIGEWKMENERYSGFKTLNVFCRDPAEEAAGIRRETLKLLNDAMFRAMGTTSAEFLKRRQIFRRVARQRNTATHRFREAFHMDTHRIRAIVEENRTVAELFSTQADPAEYQEAVRKHGIYLHMLDCAPFPLDDLAPMIPHFEKRKEKLCGIIEQNKFALLEDGRVSFCDPETFVNDMLFLDAVVKREGDDLISMHAGALQFLLDADKRALMQDDLRQLFRHTVTFALPSVWLDRSGQTFLHQQYLPILREHNREAAQKRTMYMDKMTHRELKQRAEAGEKGAVIARRMRRIMQDEQPSLLDILPPIPQQRTPEGSILQMAQQFPDVRFSVLISPSDYRSFAKRVNPADYPNIITVMIPAAGADSADLTIPAPAREAAMRCIMGRDKSEDPPAPQPDAPAPVPEQADSVQDAPEAEQSPAALPPFRAPEAIPADGSVVSTADGKRLRLGERLGSGGEGTIYAVSGAPELAAKLYAPSFCTAERYEKLCWMVRSDPGIPQLCWPQQLLFSDGCFVGFTMQRVPGTALPFQLSVAALSKPSVVNGIMQKWDRAALARLCERICTAMDAFPAGVLMGDINPNNFLLDIDAPEQARFWIVDCDSFQVDRWHCPVGTEAFTSPMIFENHGAQSIDYSAFFRTREDEDYAVATLLFLILMGSHPYSAIGKTSMVRAIREHRFAYRSTDQQTDQTSGRDVPDGPYRLIWSNMPVYLRETFEAVFRRGEHVSLKSWVERMRRYSSDLGKGWFDRTVLPTKYFDRTGTTFVDFVCDFCDSSGENMYAAKYESNRRHNRPNLCRTCFSTLLRSGDKLDDEPVTCEDCGERFLVTVRDRMRYEKGFLPHPKCSACRQEVSVPCATQGCGNQVVVRRGYLLSARRDGKKLRCSACREEITARCQWSEGCGNEVCEPRFKMIELTARGKPYRPLCREHRELLRNRRGG